MHPLISSFGFYSAVVVAFVLGAVLLALLFMLLLGKVSTTKKERRYVCTD